MKKTLLCIIAFLFIANTVMAFQVENPLIKGPGGTGSLEEIIDKVLSWLWPISIVLAALMILIGAYYLILSGGDPQKAATGRKVILAALIGFAIVTMSKGIIAMVTTVVGETPVLGLLPNIIAWVFGALITITALMIIISGFMFVTGGGNPEQIGRAKKTLLFSLIGLAVALTTRGLLYLVMSILGI